MRSSTVQTHHDISNQTEQKTKHAPHYKGLVWMLLAHFLVMFAVMYTMVYQFADVYLNLNQFYMTMMMVAPMGLGMLLFMRSMYPDKKRNTIIYSISAIGFLLFLWFMRAQTFVGDTQFLRSMIPHHSGAILMCERASLTNPEIIKLCGQIIESQKREIQQMKQILETQN